MIKIERSGSASGSISQMHGSVDPDPHQNVMDPQHCRKGTWRQVFIYLRPPPLVGFCLRGGKAILWVRNLVKYKVYYS
jgi:hypothetical protein